MKNVLAKLESDLQARSFTTLSDLATWLNGNIDQVKDKEREKLILKVITFVSERRNEQTSRLFGSLVDQLENY